MFNSKTRDMSCYAYRQSKSTARALFIHRIQSVLALPSVIRRWVCAANKLSTTGYSDVVMSSSGSTLAHFRLLSEKPPRFPKIYTRLRTAQQQRPVTVCFTFIDLDTV